jgi:hypothetical protein
MDPGLRLVSFTNAEDNIADDERIISFLCSTQQLINIA